MTRAQHHAQLAYPLTHFIRRLACNSSPSRDDDNCVDPLDKIIFLIIFFVIGFPRSLFAPMPRCYFPCSQLRPTLATPIRHCSVRPVSAYLRPKGAAFNGLPSRDRVIDFGKHKGKMLGALPSSYLKWMSKNLRARDFEEWARLADEVLRDPVYRDRIEWEAAERVLTGGSAAFRGSKTPVSDLLDISERFGWDNEDKYGWARVDFELLGTSKGGRIPRQLSQVGGGKRKGGILTMGSNISSSAATKPEQKSKLWHREAMNSNNGGLGSQARDRRSRKENKDEILDRNFTASSKFKQNWFDKSAVSSGTFFTSNTGKVGATRTKLRSTQEKKDAPLGGNAEDMGGESFSKGRKVGILRKGQQFIVGEDAVKIEEEEGEMSREERRERRRLKREQEPEMLIRSELGVMEKGKGSSSSDVSLSAVQTRSGGMVVGKEQQSENIFPGRRVLLEMIKRQGGVD